MLRKIPACISPDLMHALMSMGDGDEIVLADADFPALTYSQHLIRAHGLGVFTLLDAVLPFFPLDSFVERPVATMDWRDRSKEEPPAYETFRRCIRRHEKSFTEFEYVKRFDFHARAAKAFAVVVTGEADGNLILKKGPVMM